MCDTIRKIKLGVWASSFFVAKHLEVSRNSSYLSPLVKILTLENTKKNKFSFGVLLAYSYLCQWYGE